MLRHLVALFSILSVVTASSGSYPVEQFDKKFEHISRIEAETNFEVYLEDRLESIAEILRAEPGDLLGTELAAFYSGTAPGTPRLIYNGSAPAFWSVPIHKDGFITGFFLLDPATGNLRSAPGWKAGGMPALQIPLERWESLESILAGRFGLEAAANSRLIRIFNGEEGILYFASPEESGISRIDVSTIISPTEFSPVILPDAPGIIPEPLRSGRCFIDGEEPVSRPVEARPEQGDGSNSQHIHFTLPCLPWVKDQGAFGACVGFAASSIVDWWECGNMCYMGTGDSQLYKCMCETEATGLCPCMKTKSSAQYMYDRSRRYNNQDCRIQCEFGCPDDGARCEESLVSSGKMCGANCLCEGSSTGRAASVIINEGACAWDCQPYGCEPGCTEGGSTACTGDCGEYSGDCAPELALTSYTTVPKTDVDAQCEAIYYHGAVLTSGNVCQCWWSNGGCLCEDWCTCAPEGGHAYMYYGFDSGDPDTLTTDRFYFQNSWGKWHEDGRGEVSFGFQKRHGSMSYYFTGTPPSEPNILYNGHYVDDSATGNDDGVADPGETVDLILTLRNTGLDATSVNATLSCSDTEFITITDNSSSYGDLAHNEGKENTGDPFSFSVDVSSVPHFATFYFNITAGGGYSVVDSVSFIINRPHLLLVDDDGGDDIEKYFTDAVDSWMSSLFDVYDCDALGGAPSGDELSNYPNVIWFTGEEDEPIVSDTTLIKNYMDDGGKIFLAGQDIDDGIAESSFFADYLHASLVSASNNQVIILGIEGDPIGDGDTLTCSGGDGASNCSSPSSVEPLGGAQIAFFYPLAPGNAMIYYENSYKMVYCSTSFESISSAGDRRSLAGRILEMFGLATGIELISLQATETGDGVTINWDVTERGDYSGANLYRADGKQDGTWASFARLNAETIHAFNYSDFDLVPGHSYKYRLTLVQTSGETDAGELTIRFNGVPAAGYEFKLGQNQPNPFNPVTIIGYEIPGAPGASGMIPVKLAIFDLSGRLVRTLVDSELPPGRHAALWDGRNETMRGVASGVYVYRLEIPGNTATRKLLILK